MGRTFPLFALLLAASLAGCQSATLPTPVTSPPPDVAASPTPTTDLAPLPHLEVLPGAIVTVTTVGPSPKNGEVRLETASGLTLALPVLASRAQSLDVAAPILLDAKTGALSSGRATLLLLLANEWTPVATLDIGELPDAPGELGAVTLRALSLQAWLASVRTAEVEFWQRALNGTTNLTEDRLPASSATRFTIEASQAIQNGSYTEGLADSDRILALWFSGMAAMADLSTQATGATGAGVTAHEIARSLDLETIDKIADGAANVKAVSDARNADGDTFSKLLAVTSGILGGMRFVGVTPPPQPGIALGGSAAAMATRDVTTGLFDTIERANEAAVTGEDVAEPSLTNIGGKLLAGFFESGSTVLEQLHGGIELSGIGSWGRTALTWMDQPQGAREKIRAALADDPYEGGVGWITGTIVDETRGSGLDHVVVSVCDRQHTGITRADGEYAIPLPGGDRGYGECDLLAWHPPGVNVVAYDILNETPGAGEVVENPPIRGRVNESVRPTIRLDAAPGQQLEGDEEKEEDEEDRAPPPARLAFAPGTPPRGETDVPYRHDFCRRAATALAGPCGGEGTLDPTGGAPPYHFQLDSGVGFPPMGLVLSPDGVLSGTPSVAGSSRFSVCAVDTVGAQSCLPVVLTVEQGRCRSPLEGNWSGTMTQSAYDVTYVGPDYERGIASHSEKGPPSTISFTLFMTIECEGEWDGPRGERPGQGGLAFKTTYVRVSAPELECVAGCVPPRETVQLMPPGAGAYGYIDIYTPNNWNFYSGTSAGTIGVSADGTTMSGTGGQVYLGGPSDYFLHRARGFDGADPWEWSLTKVP